MIRRCRRSDQRWRSDTALSQRAAADPPVLSAARVHQQAAHGEYEFGQHSFAHSEIYTSESAVSRLLSACNTAAKLKRGHARLQRGDGARKLRKPERHNAIRSLSRNSHTGAWRRQKAPAEPRPSRGHLSPQVLQMLIRVIAFLPMFSSSIVATHRCRRALS